MSYEITGTTVLTGLLGRPVAHSISPAMHNESFRILGLDYAYLAFDVGTEELQSAVEGLKTLGAKGFNLTMPNKNKMCDYVDHLSKASQISGAINTVVNDNGILTGYTTDGIGYMRAVKDAGFDIVGKKMTLMGAGGAATSVLVQAALDGVASINVFSIRDQFFGRAQTIVDKLNKETSCSVSLYDFDDESVFKKSIAESDILTNGTSVGMAPNTDACIIKDESVFRPDLIVSDVIYNPRETKLLSMAKAHGCPTFNGMYMLLYQGAAAFELWTGKEMPVEQIKAKYFA